MPLKLPRIVSRLKKALSSKTREAGEKSAMLDVLSGESERRQAANRAMASAGEVLERHAKRGHLAYPQRPSYKQLKKLRLELESHQGPVQEDPQVLARLQERIGAVSRAEQEAKPWPLKLLEKGKKK